MKQTDFNILKSFARIILAITMLFCLGGCIMPIYIPREEHGYSHQKEVTKDMMKQLKPGTTTKNDVKLILEDIPLSPMTTDNTHCCYWKRIDGYWSVYFIVAYGMSGDAMLLDEGTTEDLHAFCVEFTPDTKGQAQILKRFKHFESSVFKKELNKQIDGWTQEEI